MDIKKPIIKIYVSPLPQPAGISQGFDIIRLDGIPCAYCGREMMTSKRLERTFNTDFEANTQMLDNALKLRKSLPLYKQQILNFLRCIQIFQRLNTDKQILSKAKVSIDEEIKRDILRKYDNIAAIIRGSDEKRLKLFMLFNEEKYRKIFLENPHYGLLTDFVRRTLYKGYSNNMHNETNKRIEAEISDIEKGKEKYLKNYILRRIISWKAKEFYLDLFSKAIASADHVIPRSKGGSDTRDNFLAVCKDCNERKTDLPLPIFMLKRPEVKTNIENQLRFLKERIPKWILQRKLESIYRDYIENINGNLSVMTNGEISLIG